MEKVYSKGLVMITATNPLLYIVVFCLLYSAVLFASNTAPLDMKKQNLSSGVASSGTRKVVDVVEEHNPLKTMFERLVTGKDRVQLESTGYACHSARYSYMCVANRPVRIDTHVMRVYLPSDNQTIPQSQRVIRPYARNYGPILLNAVTPVHIVDHSNFTQLGCNYIHNVPAVIFSSGGYGGNQFYDLSEVIIPLFLTSRHFKSRVRFIKVDYNPNFVTKYRKILSQLSDYEVINPATNGTSASVHCFPSAIVGLHFHDHLAINSDDIPVGYSMLDFKQFLRETYNMKMWTVSEIEKPVAILISRVGSRTLFNEETVGLMEELGFRVILARPSMMKNLEKFIQVVNSCSVMIGIHGAGLANELFLSSGAVMVQVVPLGLDWASTTFFGEPAKAMGVHYLEYKIQPEESSLYKLYGRDHTIIVHPESIVSMGYEFERAVYVDGQHVRIDLVRFRETLVEALRLLQL